MAASKTHNPGADLTSLPVLEGDSWTSPFGDQALSQLTRALPEKLRSRRWFRAKARTISRVEVEDVVSFPEAESWLLVIRIGYQEGEDDTYLLLLSSQADKEGDVLGSPASEPLAVLQVGGEKRILYSAVANPGFRNAILAAVANNRSFEGGTGQFSGRPTELPRGIEANLNVQLESTVSRAEQSNTSIIFGDQFIAKLFRKLESGINPDIEVGTFLTEHGFANTPAVLGTLEYSAAGRVYAAGILQKFVRNQGDAWDYTLQSLGSFFKRALASGKLPEPAGNDHPLYLAEKPVPPDVRALLGDYLDSAILLGKRTAEMHRVLGSDNSLPDFAPEPLTAEDGQKLQAEMLKQTDIAYQVLRQKQASISGQAAESARQLLALEDQVRDRFSPLASGQITADRIRFHGDYHLGQVLFTGTDFMIIDFEGEPARPLSERRDKTIALRDVAGMIRSFQYAAYAALFGQIPGLSLESERPEAIEPWSALWNSWISAAYLRGYLEAAGDASFLPARREERKLLLDAFLLHKALYEVAYELNNRPDWVRIPLRGILTLVQ